MLKEYTVLGARGSEAVAVGYSLAEGVARQVARAEGSARVLDDAGHCVLTHAVVPPRLKGLLGWLLG